MNTDEENVAAAAPTAFNLTENGYLVEQFTRPETTGYALLDSPARRAGGGRVAPPVTVSVAFSAFPSEIFKAPSSWI
jgi:hypothetical protein